MPANELRSLDELELETDAARQEATMERIALDMSSLFAQLGIPNDEGAIAGFIRTHSPLDSGVQLHEAGFWSSSQASFLREAILDDAEWAAIVDALNSEFHTRH